MSAIIEADAAAIVTWSGALLAAVGVLLAIERRREVVLQARLDAATAAKADAEAAALRRPTFVIADPGQPTYSVSLADRKDAAV